MTIIRYKEVFFKEDNVRKAYYFAEKNLLNTRPDIHSEVKFFTKDLNCETFQQELFHFLYDDREIPKCPICGKDCKFWIFSKGYRKTCNSRNCNKELSNKSRSENNMTKYGVENVFQLDSVKQKVKQFQFDKYGDWQIRALTYDFKNEAPEDKARRILKTSKTVNTDEFRAKRKAAFEKSFIERHSNLDIIEIYSDWSIKIKCPDCSKEYIISQALFYNRTSKNQIPCLNCKPYGKSALEITIQTFLDDLKIHILRNTRSVISPLELDFYLPDYNLAIETNAMYWHCEDNVPNDYHIKKKEMCESKGVHLIYLWEDEIYYNLEIIKSRLLNLLGMSSHKIYARKCEIKPVSSKDSIEFLNANHLQGSINASIRYGLYYNNALVSIMTFGKIRVALGKSKMKNVETTDFELYRFANLLNHNVVGGFSKLLSHFKKSVNFSNLISYANRDWTDLVSDNVYSKNGFKISKVNKTSYFYINSAGTDLASIVRYNRFSLRKDVLVAEGADPNMSEKEILNKRGFKRVFTSGTLKYELI